MITGLFIDLFKIMRDFLFHQFELAGRNILSKFCPDAGPAILKAKHEISLPLHLKVVVLNNFWNHFNRYLRDCNLFLVLYGLGLDQRFFTLRRLWLGDKRVFQPDSKLVHVIYVVFKRTISSLHEHRIHPELWFAVAHIILLSIELSVPMWKETLFCSFHLN